MHTINHEVAGKLRETAALLKAWLTRSLGSALFRRLAVRIHDTLHVESLEALENAARDGQLANVEGLGVKRLETIESWLQKHLDEQRRSSRPVFQSDVKPVAEVVLKVDEEYRAKIRVLAKVVRPFR